MKLSVEVPFATRARPDPQVVGVDVERADQVADPWRRL